jgi:hypothetical protein
MTDTFANTFANILARLAALEQAVGVAQLRTEDRPRRRLPTVAVAQRYNVVPRTIDRWAKDPELEFPAAEVINRRRYWDEDSLDAWDQARIRNSVSNAEAARPRRSGSSVEGAMDHARCHSSDADRRREAVQGRK